MSLAPAAPADRTSGDGGNFDVAIIGGGLAGSAASAVLGRRGMRVIVVDPNPAFPPWFRAEKIEPDQAELLQRLDLYDGVEKQSTTIQEVLHGMHGRVVHRRKVKQLGISYQTLVEAVRSQIPANVNRRFSRVNSVATSTGKAELVLADGSAVTARLCLVACGMPGAVSEQVGAQKNVVHAELTMVFGFMLERQDQGRFDFESITYRPTGPDNKIGYVTLFGMGQHMRVNVFAYWPAQDALTREMLKSPMEVLDRFAPGLQKITGACKVSGKVELYKIDLYRMAGVELPGIVLLGDAYQSPCPSTGMGVSKVLTDVDVLCNECLPGWLEKPSISADDVAQFYAHPRKIEMDDRALQAALSGRRGVVDNSLHWRLRRQIRSLRFATGW